MSKLSTTYLGLPLKNPIVASSSSLTGSLESLQRLEEAGVGAVVLKSLFEEQLDLEALKLHESIESTKHLHAEAASYFQDFAFDNTPADYLSLIEQARKAVSIPVIASLNGVRRGTWVDFAQRIEAAGASALELNLYSVPTDPEADAAQLEREYLETVEAVRAAVKLPVSVKLSPFFTSLPHFVAQLAARGVNAVSLFNRFYQPRIELDRGTTVSRIDLSRPEDALLPLRWIALLHGRVPGLELAATSGIHDGAAALRAIAAGAQVAMITSVLYREKLPAVGRILAEMKDWLEESDHASVDALRGTLGPKSTGDARAFERAQYIKALVGFE